MSSTDRNSKAQLQQEIRTQAAWPTVRQLSEDYGVPERYVRATIERRQVIAVHLDHIRIDPDSWDAFMRTRAR